MAVTGTKTRTRRGALNQGDLNDIANALKLIKAGNALSVVKVVVGAITATATPDITSAAVKAAATITGLDALQTGENLPPIGQVVSLRVVASGTGASLGTYGVSDAGGTAIVPPGGAGAAMGIALLSDDGKTLTFPNTITQFTIQYIPRAENIGNEFAPKT
jgi:hypothetical protein